VIFSKRDRTGRTNEVLLLGEWLVTFWSDHAACEILTVNPERAEDRAKDHRPSPPVLGKLNRLQPHHAHFLHRMVGVPRDEELILDQRNVECGMRVKISQHVSSGT